jgi:hypothetical protein
MRRECDVGVTSWRLESGLCTKKDKTRCRVGCGLTNERAVCREWSLLGCCIALAPIQLAEGCRQGADISHARKRVSKQYTQRAGS